MTKCLQHRKETCLRWPGARRADGPLCVCDVNFSNGYFASKSVYKYRKIRTSEITLSFLNTKIASKYKVEDIMKQLNKRDVFIFVVIFLCSYVLNVVPFPSFVRGACSINTTAET